MTLILGLGTEADRGDALRASWSPLLDTVCKVGGGEIVLNSQLGESLKHRWICSWSLSPFRWALLALGCKLSQRSAEVGAWGMHSLWEASLWWQNCWSEGGYSEQKASSAGFSRGCALPCTRRKGDKPLRGLGISASPPPPSLRRLLIQVWFSSKKKKICMDWKLRKDNNESRGQNLHSKPVLLL